MDQLASFIPRRRLRDRLVERDGTRNPRLVERYELTNQLLLVDDDLRETALALVDCEKFLGDALALLDSDQVSAERLMQLAKRDDTLASLDHLADSLMQLRRRLGFIAHVLDQPASPQRR